MHKKNYYIFNVVIFFMFFTLLMAFSYPQYNFKKLVEKDYEPLYNQAKILEEDFSQIFFMDNAKYELKDEQMKVILSKEKIQLELIFNKELNEIISEKKYDNYLSIKNLILISFETAFIVTILLNLVCMMLSSKR